MSLVIDFLLRVLIPVNIGFGCDSTLTLRNTLYRLEGQSAVDAVINTDRVPLTQVANEGYLFLIIEIRGSKGASSDAFGASDALFCPDAHHWHAAVNVSCPRRTHLNTDRSGAVHTHGRDVQTLAHEADHPNA
jgi:hypothetical protein